MRPMAFPLLFPSASVMAASPTKSPGTMIATLPRLPKSLSASLFPMRAFLQPTTMSRGSPLRTPIFSLCLMLLPPCPRRGKRPSRYLAKKEGFDRGRGTKNERSRLPRGGQAAMAAGIFIKRTKAGNGRGWEGVCKQPCNNTAPYNNGSLPCGSALRKAGKKARASNHCYTPLIQKTPNKSSENKNA